MIIDIECSNQECKTVKEVLIKSDAPLPACEKCGGATERVWSMSRKGDHTHCNRASVAFRMNYLEN